MFRVAIACLIWLSSVRCEAGMNAQMPEPMMEDKVAMSDPSLLKPKRESYHNPCPPVYSHPISYAPPPQILIKPAAHPAPMHYIDPSVLPKPIITYVKSQPAPVLVKPIAQPKIYPIVQKPMIQYAPVYQKPIYYAPSYPKMAYEAPKVYVKKYEIPVAQVIQKPQMIYPVQYHQPKVIQVPAPQISYVKIAQPVHPQPVYQSAIKPYCP